MMNGRLNGCTIIGENSKRINEAMYEKMIDIINYKLRENSPGSYYYLWDTEFKKVTEVIVNVVTDFSIKEACKS